MLVNVLIPSYRQTILTYSTDQAVQVGQLVTVTIRGKFHHGIVWELNCTSEVPNILPIHEISDKILSKNYLDYIVKVSQYNLVSLSEILSLCLTELNEYSIEPYYIYEGDLYSVSYLIDKIGKRVFNKLLKEDKLTASDFKYEFKSDLDPEQQEAWTKIKQAGSDKPMVIQGRTGSGKTNLYFNIINTILQKKQKVLILMPEISLTNTFAERVSSQFGFHPHIWNSNIATSSKNIVWNWAISDQPGIVIGSRSALWLPFINLGLIVVDEEHDNSYKQENSPRYNARDMSILRKKYEGCAVVLVSATPSLETWFNVRQNKYNLISLEGDQPIEAKIVHRKANEWLSADLKKAIDLELAKGNQCMLFLNRKGLARSLFCGVCQQYLMCNYCSSNLVLYGNFVVACSYCGKKTYLKNCTNCDNMSWQTYGIGVDKIEEEARAIFPEASIGTFTGDLAKLFASIEDIHSGKINLIISTQILSKGYNFLKLSLIGILQGEQGMNSNDPRNTEKNYQLLTQVRGRCGRDKKLQSYVFIQSSDSKNELLNYVLKNDFVTWADKELEFRTEHKLPPVFKLIRIVIYSPKMINAEADAKFLHKMLSKISGCDLFDPVPNQLHKYKSKFHYSIIIRYHHKYYPQPEISEILSKLKLPKSSQFFVDVDPQQFL